MSIRSQLLLRLIMVSVILVGGTAWLGYDDVRNETRELFDAQLARSARLILSIVQAQNGSSGYLKIQQYLDENQSDFISADTENNTQKGHVYETKLAFQIWDNEGNLVVKSHNAPLEPIISISNGFNNTIIDNYHWRTFSLLSNNKRYQCITAERVDVRNDLIFKISDDLFYMFIFLIPALSLIMYLSIDRGLKPLQRLASQINRRDGNNLELITDDYKYTETATIKNALNQLLRRLNEALAREKRITSDAAHELRTPLAAIRLHTELAKTAKNLQQKDESLDQVIHSVDRTTHLVEQLLTLARLEPELLISNFTSINIADLIIEESTLLSPIAINKEIEISFHETDTKLINGSEIALRLLIRNLLSNAISYTPKNGKVIISLSQRQSQITLSIEDNGPGISMKDRERVMERFYRAENHQTLGCGIGLSIVDRVVKMHQGSLQLCQPGNTPGLKVIVILPVTH